jgi:Invasion protein B family
LSIDIVQLVKEAMQKLGCGSAVDDSIDPHSPICISLNSLSDMFVEVEDERVVLWSKLPYGGEAHLSCVAVDLIGHFLPRKSPAFISAVPPRLRELRPERRHDAPQSKRAARPTIATSALHPASAASGVQEP